MPDAPHRGSAGPLLTWSAPARAFVIRAGRQREPFAWPKAGVIFDILNMKTGWCSTATGGGPLPQPLPRRLQGGTRHSGSSLGI